MYDVHPVSSLGVVLCVICSLWKTTLHVHHADAVNKECSAR